MIGRADGRRVLVTGARGYVGAALVAHGRQTCGWDVIASARAWGGISPQHGLVRHAADLADPAADWSAALHGADTVIHCAALVHGAGLGATAAAFRQINVEATARLAMQARAAGVRRFVLLSTIAVHGRHCPVGLNGRSPTAPADDYARSKLAGELALRQAAAGTMEIALLRPPAVYGRGAPGNVSRLVEWIRRARPVPLPRTANRRSLIGIDNLLDVIVRCVDHPGALDTPLVVADREVLSAAELAAAIATALGVPQRTIAVPAGLLRAGARATGRPGLAAALCDDQWATGDDAARLGWTPPRTLRDGLNAYAIAD